MNSPSATDIEAITKTLLKYKVFPGEPFHLEALAAEIVHVITESERRAELAKDLRSEGDFSARTLHAAIDTHIASRRQDQEFLDRLRKRHEDERELYGLIGDRQSERSHAADDSAVRNLSLAITHLADALLKISPSLQPNPGAPR